MAITDAALLDEFETDPEAMGYADPNAADGYKPTKTLTGLLGMRRYTANSDPAPQVPKPFTMADLMGKLSQASITNIYGSGNSGWIAQAVAEQDRTAMHNWINAAETAGDINSAEATDLRAVVDAQHDDPDHPAEVPDGVTPRLKVRWNAEGITAEQVDRVLGRS